MGRVKWRDSRGKRESEGRRRGEKRVKGRDGRKEVWRGNGEVGGGGGGRVWRRGPTGRLGGHGNE